MDKINYNEFDAKLFKRILNSPATFASLAAHMDTEARAIAEKKGAKAADAFRVTDSRLQALRKRGLISYSSKAGWTYVEPKGGA